MFFDYSVVVFLFISVLLALCHTQLTTINDIDSNINSIYSYNSTQLTINEHSVKNNSDNEKIAEIPICCPINHYVKRGKCRQNETLFPNVKDVEFPEIYDKNLQVSNKTPSDFRREYGNPCKNGLYPLEPGDPHYDVFYLLDNGTVYENNSQYESPDRWRDKNEFCLGYVTQNNSAKSAVLVCFDTPAEEEIIPLIYPIALIVSAPFLAITFMVYAMLPELKNIHGLTLMAYCGPLFIAYIALATIQIGGVEVIHMRTLCMTLAYIIHFAFLASFFWLNVMCFDIWWTFGGFRSLQGSLKQRERKKFAIYSIYAWGYAGILTMICVIMDHHPSIPQHYIRPEFGEEACWFRTEKAKALYFYGPMGITIVCNIYLFIATAIKILHHKKETASLRGIDSHRHDDNKQWFNLYLKLFIVMGINWSMEIISWLFKKKAPDFIWSITDLVNALQGVIIFVIFVCKKKIKRLLLRRFGFRQSTFRSGNSTRSATCTSTTSTRTCTSTITTPNQEEDASLMEMNRVSRPRKE